MTYVVCTRENEMSQNSFEELAKCSEVLSKSPKFYDMSFKPYDDEKYLLTTHSWIVC